MKKNKYMEKMNKFLEPAWRKIALVVFMTVITYASVSQTVLQLNKQSRAADVCYNFGSIPINNQRNLANTINTYIANNRSGSAFSAIPDVGMVFVQSAVKHNVNPLYLLGIAENETTLATNINAPSMKGGNPFGRKALTTERSFCTGLSDTCDAANRWYVYPGGYTTSMIDDQALYLSQNPSYAGASSVAFTKIIGDIIAQAGTAVSCSVANTTNTTSTTSTTLSDTPSCVFNPTSYSTSAGVSVALRYSTANASSAQICSSGGTCAVATVGSLKTFSANPTASTTYTMTVRNTAGATRTCTASVSVTATTTTTVASTTTTLPGNHANSTTNPTVILVSATVSGNSVTLTAKGSDVDNNNTQLAFRIRQDNPAWTTAQKCATVQSSAGIVPPDPFREWKVSGATNSYTFTGLTSGTYKWSAKARDEFNNYSNDPNLQFCYQSDGTTASLGWQTALTFTIP